MLYLIIIFVVSIITAFVVLNYSAWEVRNNMRNSKRTWHVVLPPIRHFEKYLLYSLKHLIQNLVLIIIKYWIMFITKVKKWTIENWPKVKRRFTKNKDLENDYPKSPSFVRRAVFESKIKIKRMKQKIKEDNDMNR